MNTELKTKWVAALRSGDYKQGHFRLRRADKYCCLGVLCEVMDVESSFVDGSDEYRYDDHAQKLSKRLLESAGLERDTQDSLAVMNDEGSSFAQIADYIERRL